MLDALMTIPLWYTALTAFGFGVIIGSFLNVVIYRFHTGKSLSGSSHCLSCQTDLHWYELFPLLSYLTLRGRCRTCSASIPGRYFWVELATGLLFMLVALMLSPWYWLFGVMIVSILVVVAVYDLYHMVIPNFFVWLLLLLVLLTTVLDYWLLSDVVRILWQLLAGALSYGFFASLWYFSKGRWIGYGDAKLALPLGYLLGLVGAFSMIVLSFWIGTIISLGLIGVSKLRHKRGQSTLRFMSGPLTIKSEVPFAPFLIIAFLLVYLFGVDVLSLISYVLPV